MNINEQHLELTSQDQSPQAWPLMIRATLETPKVGKIRTGRTGVRKFSIGSKC
jgi:hypothetical protein